MNKPGPSRKRKRGTKKNFLMEDDDDASEFVTFEEVTINTPGGPVKRISQVPLRPNPDSQERASSHPEKFPSSETNDFAEVSQHLDDDEPMQEMSKNKVV
jgi:hypothetical protein